jgi:phenylacetate-coenzyme A ligase PaaK-like adenylate-forming protein
MIDSAFAQTRVSLSIAFGRPMPIRALEQVVTGLRSARREFGALPRSAEVMGPTLDAEAALDLQRRRLRQVARLAGMETPFYAERFAALGLDPCRLSDEALARLPLTTKVELRARPDDFVRRSTRGFLRPTTTGTTGRPTAITFSEKEMRLSAALQAIDALSGDTIREDDILQIATASRGLLGNVSLAAACAHVGALVTMTGITDPAYALAQLAEPHNLPGKRRQVSVLYTYPSYLGELVETGLRLGYGPADFGLRLICAGGEIVTEAVQRRAQALFGDVNFTSGYGMTEIWPLGGSRCEAGHLHFQPSYGMVEVLDLDEDRPAAPGQPGRIVATPFLPFRESTLLLRYDTEDLVRAPSGPVTCSQRHLPATGELLGKRKHALCLDSGWVFARDVLEAVESVSEVPLPAQLRWDAAPSGIALTVAIRPESNRPATRRALAAALEARGVPLASLTVCDGPPPGRFPWRASQRELTL